MNELHEAVSLRTPGGEDLVILSRQHYERLLELAEDAIDVAAYDRGKEELAAGKDRLVPFEAVPMNRDAA